jgi:hypothetical protein
MFGAPEFDVKTENEKIVRIEVVRGAPCGATWDAAIQAAGRDVEEAIVKMGLETQFYCTADPSGWDPIYGKSPVHFAGKIHAAALKRAVERSRE